MCESLECLAATTSKMLSACSTWVRDPGFALMTIMNSLFRLEKCRIELHKTSAIQPNFQEFGGHLSGMQCIFLLTNGLDLARRVYDIAFKNVERMDQIYNGSNGHGRVHSVFEIRAKCKPDSADMSSLACSWRMYHENMNQTPARNKILNSAVCWNFRAELEQKIHEPTTLCPCIFRAALPPPPPYESSTVNMRIQWHGFLKYGNNGSTLAKHIEKTDALIQVGSTPLPPTLFSSLFVTFKSVNPSLLSPHDVHGQSGGEIRWSGWPGVIRVLLQEWWIGISDQTDFLSRDFRCSGQLRCGEKQWRDVLWDVMDLGGSFSSR